MIVLTMADIISKQHRSWNMARIRSKDTEPERIVRSILHKMGYRFRLHQKDLPGMPDIVLRKHGTVILVHGCFWHRHPLCKLAYNPKSRMEFWERKFKRNIERDGEVQQQLKGLGWKVITIWECETFNTKDLEKMLCSQLLKIDQETSGN